uniref:Uncharacterized protein n=1 Tax=Oryza barthii TaxID=65489 RepID=A0A0D3HQ69_9ORYZ
MAMAMQKIRALGGRRQWRAGAACRQIQARTPRKSATKLHMETDCRKILIRHENPSPLASSCTDDSTLCRSICGSTNPLISSIAGHPTCTRAAGNLDVHVLHAPQNGRVSNRSNSDSVFIVSTSSSNSASEHAGDAAHRRLLATEAPQAPGELVVVAPPAAVDVDVDAVEHGVAERAGHAPAAAAEVEVPEVVGDGLGRLVRGQRVLVAGAADGEEDGDVLGLLAVLDVGADAGQRVAGEVGPVAAVAEDAEEGDDDGGVEAGVAGRTQ